MGQQGNLIWYATSPVTSCDMLKQLGELVGCERAELINVRRSAPRLADSTSIAGGDLQGKDLTPTEFARFYRKDVVVDVWDDFASLGDQVEAAIISSISPSIRGAFIPNRTYLMLGEDELLGSDGDGNVPFNVLVGCWGYSLPTDEDQMKCLTLKLDVVVEVQQRLQEVVKAPVEVALDYSC